MSKYQFTIILSLVLLSYNLTAQPCCANDFRSTIKDTAKTFKTAEQTDTYFQPLIREIKSDTRCPIDSLVYAHWRYGIALRNHDIRRAIHQLDTVIILKTYPNALPKNLDMSAYQQIGQLYKRKRQFDKAIDNINKAIDIHRGFGDKKGLDYRYKEIGKLYRKIGDYEQAIQNLLTAKELYIKYRGENNKKTGDAWNELGVVYTYSKNFSEAINALQKTIAIAEKNENIRQLTKALNNLGNTYEAMKDYQEAEKKYRKVFDLCSKQPKAPVQDCIKAQNNLGVSLMKLGQLQEAQTFFTQTLEAKQDLQDNVAYHYSYSATLENIGDLELAKDRHNIALDYYQKALMNLSDNFRHIDIFTNPTVQKNEFIYSKIYLIHVLDLKAKAALSFFEKNKNEQYLQLALDTYKAIDEWISVFYKDISTEKSKLEWIARAHEIYANAISVALKAEQPEHAFHFAERARAVLLWQSLSEQSARDLLSQEDRDKEDEINIEIRLQEATYFDADPYEKDSLQFLVQHLNREKEELIKSFEKKYPDYYTRKYDADFITLKEVQNEIIDNNKTALLEYFLTDSLLHVFIIKKDDIQTNKVRINDDFYRHIHDFNTAIKDENSELHEFAQPAYQLYQTALAPAMQHLNGDIEKLILIPDGKLNYVVFEALLTDDTNVRNWQELPYLLNDYTVNYLYSCNSLHTTQQMKRKSEGLDFLGVAPAFGMAHNTPQFASLYDTKDEIRAIQSMYKGNTLLGNDATKEEFIKVATHADVVHIASHATQGDGEGKIYLYGGEVMTQKDIQALPWSARQVILSACETGTGELSEGEGVLSLGWSFAYKGVPSIVMSQWEVSSASTTDLMVDYHQKLSQKLPADQALQQAKLDFRNNAENMKDAHPYHWAAFIHTGNPVTQNHPNYVWWGMALGLLVMLLLRVGRVI